MPKNIFTGEEVSEDNPNAALLTGTGFSGQFSVDLLPPEEKQEQYVAENLQAFSEKVESEEGLTADDLLMTARSFIDGLWLNKTDEAGSYMAASAVYAAKEFSKDYGIALNRIELTPMIGMNDVTNEIVNRDDFARIVSFAKDNSLGGVHYWSFDRDVPCDGGYVSPTCSSIAKGSPLDFDRMLIQ